MASTNGHFDWVQKSITKTKPVDVVVNGEKKTITPGASCVNANVVTLRDAVANSHLADTDNDFYLAYTEVAD